MCFVADGMCAAGYVDGYVDGYGDGDGAATDAVFISFRLDSISK